MAGRLGYKNKKTQHTTLVFVKAG